jgi:hypothetical protein
MTASEATVLVMWMLAGVGFLVVVYDRWTRRRDRPSSRR